MDYKNTLNLPRTDFAMKADLVKREPARLAQWEATRLYERIQAARDGAPPFVLHDGPPFANGEIHLGHVLNKILKDIVIKYKTLRGFRAPYVPGWDCHGLPIEFKVTQEMRNEKPSERGEKMPDTGSQIPASGIRHPASDLSPAAIRNACDAYARKFIAIQRDQFKRLGVLGDWDNPYLTLTKEYEAAELRLFANIVEKGFVYRGKKPVYWSIPCRTALAEAEVEYGNHVSPSIYVKFRVDPASAALPGLDAKNLFVVIWTTTPWTLPANLAVSFHPEYQYSAVKFGSEYYILARGLIGAMETVMGKEKEAEIQLGKGDIEKLKVLHPFIDRESKVIFGTHVTLEQGTGIVHTAPGHGHEDYIVGLEYGLEVYCPVDEKGRYTDDFPEMKGVRVFDANDKIVELLKQKNALIYTEKIEHSYPHCWRCKNPLIYRATEQWFLSIDHNDLRKKGIESVGTTGWIPAWGQSRFLGMVETRPDWCLSRQRSWGVPIPSFRCEKCGENLMSAASVKFFAELSRARGIDSWFTDPIGDLVPKDTRCACGNGTFVKEFDILDVWFDSGVSHFAVLDARKDHRWPADLYLEGSDQHRGWFQSSFWPALALRGRPPYNTVLTHGFVLDEEGKAMSKSQGNVLPPENIIKEYGADILRLWVSSEEYRNDVRIGTQMMKQIADSYRRIRNTFKFIIGNLSDFSETAAKPYDSLSDIDKWILHKLHTLHARVIEHYENFEFHLVYRKLQNFCAVELSSIYFDISKDILYVELPDSPRRRGVQTVLSELLKTMTRLIAPVLPFTMEEIWQFTGNRTSVHMERYYAPDGKFSNPAIEERVDRLVDIKKDVLKELENCRAKKLIKTSLETAITLHVTDESANRMLAGMGDELARFFQVATVTLSPEKTSDMNTFDTSSVAVSKSNGKKCTRCWNFFETLGSDPEHPELCGRCTTIIKAMV